MRYVAVGRAAYGLSLLLAPGAVMRVASGRTMGQAPKVVGRILGARHLVQALVVERVGTRNRLLAGTAVDAAHALSMIWLATLDRGCRRPATYDALIATGLAINGLREARNA
jgi:hypothetical protein